MADDETNAKRRGAATRHDARCAECDARIDTSRWYPIVTRIVDDEVRLHSFCDENCRDAWERAVETHDAP